MKKTTVVVPFLNEEENLPELYSRLKAVLAGRTEADGFLIGTSKDWKHAVNPSGDWAALDYDDSSWAALRDDDGRVKGPPEEPYIWVTPDPFINTLSQASGLRPSAPWGSKKGRVIYRKVFEIK